MNIYIYTHAYRLSPCLGKTPMFFGHWAMAGLTLESEISFTTFHNYHAPGLRRVFVGQKVGKAR